MQRRLTLIGLLTILAVTGCAWAQAASAARVYSVEADSVYVRNKAAGYVLGTAFKTQTIDVQRLERKGRWGYGLVHGFYGRWGAAQPCGWVQLSDKRKRVAKRTAARAPDACPSSQAGLRESRLFQKGSFLSRAGTGSVIPVTIGPCIDNHAYGNYDPRNGLFSIPRYGLIPTGRGPEAPGFGLRYVTADGRAALFKDSHNPAGATTWFFMSAQCIQRLPVYIGRTYFHNRDRVEPREFEPYKDAMLTRLRWKRWRGLRAEGAGTARVNTCEPICAVGRIERHRGAHITLSNPRQGSCKGQPAYFYTKASVTWPRGTGIRPRHQSYPLSPNCG